MHSFAIARHKLYSLFTPYYYRSEFSRLAQISDDYQTISVQKRIHRGDAEYAEKRILSITTPNSATSVPLR